MQQQQRTDINVQNSTKNNASCSSSETSILAAHEVISFALSHEPVIGTDCSPAMETHCHESGFCCTVSDEVDAASIPVSRMHTASLGTKPIASPNEHIKLPTGTHMRLSFRARNVFTRESVRATGAGTVVAKF